MKHTFARELRRQQTSFERKLWLTLRNRRLSGSKFRRQQPIGPYVADFASFEVMLVVELDGSQHDSPENAQKDDARTKFLESQGFRVLRFRNQALVESFEGVVDAIFQTAQERAAALQYPSPALVQISTSGAATLSHKGEGMLEHRVDGRSDHRLQTVVFYAVSSNNSRPISQRRISDVPAPIS
jgi:adenine-specific DNA-methyltransferase